MSFHPIIYYYYLNKWIFEEYIYFIFAGLLLILSFGTFVLSQRFQKPILFDSKIEGKGLDKTESLRKAIEMLRDALKPSKQEKE